MGATKQCMLEEMDKEKPNKPLFSFLFDDDYFDEDEAIEADFFWEVDNG